MSIAEHLSDEDLSGAVLDEIVPARGDGRDSQSGSLPAGRGDDAGSGLLDLCRESDGSGLLDLCSQRKEPSSEEFVKDLLSTQQASGAFTINESWIWMAIHESGFDPDRWIGAIDDGLQKRFSAATASEELKVTILTLLYLKLVQENDTKLWSRAAAKAQRYLAQTLKQKLVEVHKWLEELQDAVK